ncbi:hypothetical protein GY45DRAFT_490386 [Cubamyces sp. BRFM 1775]|nr:hypothetical protein GY45DRAFT_490386 [Cubamyces sp. BRFM 1775]
MAPSPACCVLHGELCRAQSKQGRRWHRWQIPSSLRSGPLLPCGNNMHSGWTESKRRGGAEWNAGSGEFVAQGLSNWPSSERRHRVRCVRRRQKILGGGSVRRIGLALSLSTLRLLPSLGTLPAPAPNLTSSAQRTLSPNLVFCSMAMPSPARLPISHVLIPRPQHFILTPCHSAPSSTRFSSQEKHAP